MVGRFFEGRIFYRLMIAVLWLTKIYFGRPNAGIGWKMANGRLLFLALRHTYISVYILTYMHILLFVCKCTYDTYVRTVVWEIFDVKNFSSMV